MKRFKLISIMLVAILVLAGCVPEFLEKEKTEGITNEKEEWVVSGELKDDMKAYEGDDPAKVTEVYVTVFPPDVNNPRYNFTFEELNQDEDFRDDYNPRVRVLLQGGEGGTPKVGYFGFGLTDSNANMRLRGHSTRRSDQKSYKVSIKKQMGKFDGHEVLNLNKHPYDSTRVRNKLSFDYIKEIPNLTSARTQFVRLYIKDLSVGDPNAQFVDFGIYTNVEQYDKDYLENHGLDREGHFYKAEYFEFRRYPDILKNKDEEGYDEDRFEEILEIKGKNDHKKILNMLDDVNDYNKDIDEVIEMHFNRENYLTWLALNLIFENIDTNSQNFYLYSPSNSNTWYFIPWDYDGAWGFYEQIGKEPGRRTEWQSGISNYWGVILHKRFLQKEENLKALNNKIEELMTIITEEKTREFLKTYEHIPKGNLNKEPDSENTPGTYEQFLMEYDRIPTVPEITVKKYHENIEKPMPIFMGEPERVGDQYMFRWEASYDLQGEEILYTFEISDTPDFLNKIKTARTTDLEYSLPLTPGTYYWRIISEDESGNTQTAFDTYRADGVKYSGVKKAVIQ